MPYRFDQFAELFVLRCGRHLRFAAFRRLFLTVIVCILQVYKRCPFTARKVVFHKAKDHVLHTEKTSVKNASIAIPLKIVPLTSINYSYLNFRYSPRGILSPFTWQGCPNAITFSAVLFLYLIKSHTISLDFTLKNPCVSGNAQDYQHICRKAPYLWPARHQHQ